MAVLSREYNQRTVSSISISDSSHTDSTTPYQGRIHPVNQGDPQISGEDIVTGGNVGFHANASANHGTV